MSPACPVNFVVLLKMLLYYCALERIPTTSALPGHSPPPYCSLLDSEPPEPQDLEEVHRALQNMHALLTAKDQQGRAVWPQVRGSNPGAGGTAWNWGRHRIKAGGELLGVQGMKGGGMRGGDAGREGAGVLWTRESQGGLNMG